MIKHIAFIGLGRMGIPITRHLLKAGYDVSGYDIAREKITTLEADGLISASSPAGQELGVPLPHAAVLLQDLLCANLQGADEKDYSFLLQVLESRAGL
jgi:3-hydroxyacyl-CoA dehydrogenase